MNAVLFTKFSKLSHNIDVKYSTTRTYIPVYTCNIVTTLIKILSEVGWKYVLCVYAGIIRNVHAFMRTAILLQSLSM